MTARQPDLFSGSGGAAGGSRSSHLGRRAMVPTDLDDDALISAIPDGDIVDGPVLAAEAGRRGLVAAVPALEALCRRLAGFGVDHAVPEQVAALEAMAMIGGGEAAAAASRIIARGFVQGPTLAVAVATAAGLGAILPVDIVLGLMRQSDRGIRADACRCARPSPNIVAILVELLDDLDAGVSTSAACALGRFGRPEGRPVLLRLLRDAPSAEVIDAIVPVADEECVVVLARVARTLPDLADAALDALRSLDDARARRLVAGIASGHHENLRSRGSDGLPDGGKIGNRPGGGRGWD